MAHYKFLWWWWWWWSIHWLRFQGHHSDLSRTAWWHCCIFKKDFGPLPLIVCLFLPSDFLLLNTMPFLTINLLTLSPHYLCWHISNDKKWTYSIVPIYNNNFYYYYYYNNPITFITVVTITIIMYMEPLSNLPLDITSAPSLLTLTRQNAFISLFLNMIIILIITSAITAILSHL